MLVARLSSIRDSFVAINVVPNIVQLWDVSKGELVISFTVLPKRLQSLELDIERQLLYISYWNEGVQIFDFKGKLVKHNRGIGRTYRLHHVSEYNHLYVCCDGPCFLLDALTLEPIHRFRKCLYLQGWTATRMIRQTNNYSVEGFDHLQNRILFQFMAHEQVLSCYIGHEKTLFSIMSRNIIVLDGTNNVVFSIPPPIVDDSHFLKVSLDISGELIYAISRQYRGKASNAIFKFDAVNGKLISQMEIRIASEFQFDLKNDLCISTNGDIYDMNTFELIKTLEWTTN